MLISLYGPHKSGSPAWLRKREAVGSMPLLGFGLFLKQYRKVLCRGALLVVTSHHICRRPQDSNGRAPSVDGEFCAVNETGTICRQKNNGLSNLVRCRRTARRRLGGQLLESLPHGVRALRARRSRAHGIDADTAGAIFSR